MNGQSIVNTGVGGAGALISYAFGGWSEAMSFLLVLIAADVITGMYASVAEGRGLNSAVGSVGLAKKGLMLLVILIAHRADILLELNDVTMTAAVYFYVANELVSLTENLGRSGLPLPDKLRDIITVLKRKGGSSGD